MSAMGTGFRHRREQAADRKCAIPSHLISSQLAPLRGPLPRTVVAFANTCAIIASFSVWDILDMSGTCCAIVSGGCHAK